MSDHLVAATGADSPDDAVRIALGRPRLGEERGPSPVIRFRVAPQMHAQLKVQAESEGCTVSDVLRAALHEYLSKHRVDG